MNNKEILEKYGIEPIMREMWVWDENFKNAMIELVLYKDMDEGSPWPYNTFGLPYRNASDTNPNEPRQPKVGDKGYFWNEEKVFYAYGLLEGIDKEDVLPYLCEGLSWHPHFSHEKQPWMK
jgi:hypothetical protein